MDTLDSLTKVKLYGPTSFGKNLHQPLIWSFPYTKEKIKKSWNKITAIRSSVADPGFLKGGFSFSLTKCQLSLS